MAPLLLHLRREQFKFSSAHLTVFPDGSKEALHGHNFQVELALGPRSGKWDDMVSFATYKDIVKELIRALDEKVLIAEDCPLFKRESAPSGSVQFTICGKRYLLPSDEVVFLPVDNISSERLAEYLLKLFSGALGTSGLSKLESIVLRVDQSDGQGASSSWSSHET